MSYYEALISKNEFGLKVEELLQSIMRHIQIQERDRNKYFLTHVLGESREKILSLDDDVLHVLQEDARRDVVSIIYLKEVLRY